MLLALAASHGQLNPHMPVSVPLKPAQRSVKSRPADRCLFQILNIWIFLDFPSLRCILPTFRYSSLFHRCSGSTQSLSSQASHSRSPLSRAHLSHVPATTRIWYLIYVHTSGALAKMTSSSRSRRLLRRILSLAVWAIPTHHHQTVAFGLDHDLSQAASGEVSVSTTQYSLHSL